MRREQRLVFVKKLEPYADGDDPDVVAESHSHWVIGHIDRFSIRIFKGGEISPAFRTYHELAERKANYPVLDESDCSQREYEATLANITDAADRHKHEYALPDCCEGDLYSWLGDH